MRAQAAETLIESFLSLVTKALGMVVKLKDADAVQNELKKDYRLSWRGAFVEMWPAARCGQRNADHHKTYRFQRR